MEFFRIHRTIPFMRHALVLNIISLVTFVAAVFFILTRGFHLSICLLYTSRTAARTRTTWTGRRWRANARRWRSTWAWASWNC